MRIELKRAKEVQPGEWIQIYEELCKVIAPAELWSGDWIEFQVHQHNDVRRALRFRDAMILVGIEE